MIQSYRQDVQSSAETGVCPEVVMANWKWVKSKWLPPLIQPSINCFGSTNEQWTALPLGLTSKRQESKRLQTLTIASLFAILWLPCEKIPNKQMRWCFRIYKTAQKIFCLPACSACTLVVTEAIGRYRDVKLQKLSPVLYTGALCLKEYRLYLGARKLNGVSRQLDWIRG